MSDHINDSGPASPFRADSLSHNSSEEQDEDRVWNSLTDEDRQRAFESLPDMLDGFLKSWGWLHFANAVEDICREKNSLPRDDRIAELEHANFSLAAGQCIEPNGLLGDDYGNQYCAIKKERDALTEEVERLRKRIDDARERIEEFKCSWMRVPHYRVNKTTRAAISFAISQVCSPRRRRKGREIVTDRELLELAAKAAGIRGVATEEGCKPTFRVIPGDGSFHYWNPLTDDRDALRLAAKLRINIYHLQGCSAAEANGGIECEEAGTDDAATRRAIVRAAAEIGKAMP